MASPPIANLRTRYHSALSRASTTRSASSSGAPTASRMRSTSASKSSPACCRNYSGPVPRHDHHAVVLAAVKDAAREWPEDGPSLTAAARAGISRVQVGTEGWGPSNKRSSGADGRLSLAQGSQIRQPTREPAMDTLSNTVAAIDSEQQKAKLFVALELGQATWVVALHSPIADKISIYRIEGGDTDQLMALIEKKRVQAARRLGRAAQVVSCYEAGRDGFWLHRFLIRRGIDNRVLDSASILVDRRARRAKTDRLAAGALLGVVMALVRGEEQVCRVVRGPSIAQEDERRLSRERERLLHERNSHIARIKGLLILHGVRDYRLIERDWKERLDAVRTTEGQALPARAKTEIERECRRLWLGQQMPAEVE